MKRPGFFWLLSHFGTAGGFRLAEGDGEDREEKTEEVKEELQNSFIRHATDEMQEYTRETERENSKAKKEKKQKTKSHHLFC